MSTAICLGCNGPAAAHDRRLLSGPTSAAAKSAWKEIIAVNVQADRSLESSAAQVEASASSGYLCRRCFKLFEQYQKSKELLLANVQSVLSSHHIGEHVLVGSKRFSAEIDDDSGNAAKIARLSAKRQLSFSLVSSPPVVVSASYLIRNKTVVTSTITYAILSCRFHLGMQSQSHLF